MITDTETIADTETSTNNGSNERPRSATIAELVIPFEDFALRETIAALEDVSFELERIVATDSNAVLPLVRAYGGDRAVIEHALAADPSVVSSDVLADFGDEWLFEMEWPSDVGERLGALVEHGGTMLAATTREQGWLVRVLFPERDALARTHDACNGVGVTTTVVRIYNLGRDQRGEFGLTGKQRDAVTLAFEHGYYDVPRRIATKDLAGEIGVSHQALSERLRRGHRSLVGTTIVTRGRSSE